jgi:L-alanine-DL-glutamate epimerase-like enolase superfamily enzyme
MARRAIADGFTCIKLKVGAGPREVQRVARVRSAVGDSVELRLDANGSWTEAYAKRVLKAFATHGISYVEQPVSAREPAALARLASNGLVDVAADESAHDFRQARALVKDVAVPIVIVKPMALGGLDRAADLVALARTRNVKIVVTDSLESSVGRMGALHLAALLEAPRPACGLATGRWLSHDVTKSPPIIQRGAMRVPARPGLGLEVAQPREVLVP